MELTLTSSELKERLLQAGIRPSIPRMAIASYLLTTTHHPTAEDIKKEVERALPTISLATIYNTLSLFVKKKLIRQLEILNKHTASKSIRYDKWLRPHFHFLDEDTGQMLDLDAQTLKIIPSANFLNNRFQISEIEILIRGRQKKSNPENKKEITYDNINHSLL